MTKTINKILALTLALCMILGLASIASAAEIGNSGGSGSTPVNLTTTADGSLDGPVAPTAMSVTVPTALPMAMAQDGSVTTASNCKITNNSYGAVRVASVTITAGPNWKLTAFGDKSTLAGQKVDSNQLGFAMSIGGGAMVCTNSGNTNTQALISAPIAGCYMTGIGDPSGNSVSIDYAAIVTPLSGAMTNETIASIVFVVEWDT